jgi:quercetin dioxygenase-like cupin family protein
MMTAQPLVLSAEEGVILRTQVQRLVKASVNDTDNALSFTVVSIGEGFQGPPRHLHRRHAESFYVLQGSFRFALGDDERLVHEGGFVFVPPMTPHAFVSADGRGGRMIEIFSPADFEGYFEAIARIMAGGGSRSDIATAQSKYGMDVLGPPLGAPDG